MNRIGMIVLVVVLVASVALNFTIPAKEDPHIWDVKAFFAVYGFVGALAAIFLSRWIGQFLLQRDEGYYAPHGAPEEAAEFQGKGEEGRDA